MIKNLDTNLVRAFVSVSTTGSMTATAESLGRSQGAISQQILRLEDLFGTRLFEREKSGMQLTEAGRRFLPLAQTFLSQNDEIFRQMSGGGLTGKARLGMPYDLVKSFLPAVLRRFRDAFPGVSVDLICDASPDLLSALNAGKIDVAIIEEPMDAITGDCLWFEQLLWIGSKEGAAYRDRPLPLSIVDRTCVFRPAVEQGLNDAGIPWRCVFENGNIDATMAAVRADIAVSASLASMVPSDVQILTDGDGLPDLPSFAVTLHSSPLADTAGAQQLVAFLRRAAKSHSIAR